MGQGDDGNKIRRKGWREVGISEVYRKEARARKSPEARGGRLKVTARLSLIFLLLSRFGFATWNYICRAALLNGFQAASCYVSWAEHPNSHCSLAAMNRGFCGRRGREALANVPDPCVCGMADS